MNNIERSKMLMSAAEESLAEAKFSFNREVWGLAIRRSQEAVELGLGGVLAFLGLDYPKNHDKAPLLFKILKSQGMSMDDEAKKIEIISLDLSRKRGPALQQEEGYDSKVAKKAIDEAKYVLDYSKTLLVNIKKKLVEGK